MLPSSWSFPIWTLLETEFIVIQSRELHTIIYSSAFIKLIFPFLNDIFQKYCFNYVLLLISRVSSSQCAIFSTPQNENNSGTSFTYNFRISRSLFLVFGFSSTFLWIIIQVQEKWRQFVIGWCNEKMRVCTGCLKMLNFWPRIDVLNFSRSIL